SVPFFTRKPLLETVKGFFRLYTFQKIPFGYFPKRSMAPLPNVTEGSSSATAPFGIDLYGPDLRCCVMTPFLCFSKIPEE
ncbi:MAG: hypothetical protein ACN6ON_19595, partial [Sphingobacterium sp.]